MNDQQPNIDDLPNPRLAEFLRSGFVRMTEDERRVELRAAHLRAAGLPADYDDLSDDGRKSARMDVLLGWYDRKRPNVLVSDVERLLKAAYLWVEEYYKPAAQNRGVYYHRDPRHKYDMIRSGFSAPMGPDGSAKAIITAPRGSTKTQTFIQQLAPMMAICRPDTEILISEINEKRCGEEMQKVQQQIEHNELIQADFGAKGVLFPRSSRPPYKWNDKRLDFVHMANCRIMADSFYSKQRGRHPPLWIIDDPEDGDNIRAENHKRNFIELLFGRGTPMSGQGGHILWITTRILGGIADMAINWDLYTQDDLDEEMEEISFDDWTRVNFDLLVERDDGTVESLYPDHISIEAYEQKERSMGRRRAMAEYRGVAIAAGAFVFIRDDYRHGYMHCIGGDKPGECHEYMFDLKTGKTMDWSDFIDSLYICAACDLAVSLRPGADFSAYVLIGIDPHGVIYVLDVMIRRMLPDNLVGEVYSRVAMYPKCSVIGWERDGFQQLVLRLAQKFCSELERRDQPAPRSVGIINAGKSKLGRIIGTLRVPYETDKIRFPHFQEIETADGLIHRPKESSSEKYFRMLKRQLDGFTDEGASDYDDGPDALQMAIRLAGRRKGLYDVPEDENEQIVNRFRDIGFEVRANTIPPECWTKEMRERFAAAEKSATAPVPEFMEMDPYAVEV